MMESNGIKRPLSNCRQGCEGLTLHLTLEVDLGGVWPGGRGSAGHIWRSPPVPTPGALLGPLPSLASDILHHHRSQGGLLVWPPWPRALPVLSRPLPRPQSPFPAGLPPGSTLNLFSSVLSHYVTNHL